MTARLRLLIMRAVFVLYQIIGAIVFVVALPFYALGRLVGGRPFGSLLQRLGFNGGRSSRHDVWFHAVSVGEVNAARIIIGHLRAIEPSLKLLVTTTTVTGRSLAERLFPEATVTWFPFDFTFSVRRFLERYSPRLHVIVETELWPVVAREVSRAGMALMMVNARISDRSFPRYHRLRFFGGKVLELFDLILAREAIDKTRLVAIGAPEQKVRVAGNVKFDYTPDEQELPFQSFLDRFSNDEAILFASTAEGEELLLIDVILKLIKENRPVIVAPRKQTRFDEVAELLSAKGIPVIRRSNLSNEQDPERGSLLLLDSIGELARVYRSCAAAFIGGSLVPHGGQNPVEACAVGCVVAIGPHTSNFRDITEELLSHEAAQRVSSPEELEDFFERVIQNPELQRTRSENARRAIEANRGAADEVVREIRERLR